MNGLTPDVLTDVVQKGDAKELHRLVDKLPDDENYKILRKTHSKAAIKLLRA